MSRDLRTDHGTDHGTDPDADHAVVVSGLRKSYRGRPALAGVDLAIPRGEVFSLLGPNGAGKTTTVEILEGHRRRDAGQVRVLGVDPALGQADWKARIGIVSQHSDDLTQGGALTVRDWVRVIAACFPNARKPDEVIELVGLTDRRDARATHLSGGQRRRLDVALGIVGRPELLFLDEPTSGFDPEARRRFWDLIADLAKSGTTIVLTTHYLEEAEHLADRVAVIVDGRIMAVGPPRTLGGRDTAAATVRWLSPNGPRSVETHTPAVLVTKLVAEFGEDVPGLEVERPSLEDVYLRMIGHLL